MIRTSLNTITAHHSLSIISSVKIALPLRLLSFPWSHNRRKSCQSEWISDSAENNASGGYLQQKPPIASADAFVRRQVVVSKQVANTDPQILSIRFLKGRGLESVPLISSKSGITANWISARPSIFMPASGTARR
jgi:hypothetical protein